MKCINCGAYVYSSDKFCRSCGVTLNEDTCEYGDNISDSKYDSSSCHNIQYTYSYNYSNKSEQDYNMNATHTDQYDYSSKYSIDNSRYNYISSPNDSGGDDKYLKAYIGLNYEKIKNLKFSFLTLIFGPWYLLYRKIWNYAIGIIIISFAATILLEENLAELVNLVISVTLAIKFKNIYFKQAENHVESIKQQNLDKSTNELLEICRKKGGTSILAPILIVFASIILLAFSSIIFTA